MKRVSQRAILCFLSSAASHTPRRSIITGHIPTEGTGPNAGPSSSWTLQRGHHLQSSMGLHTPFKTACGRDFNPTVYYELLQACCDQQWMMAIQREIRTDTEYVNHLRQNGGAARDMKVLTDASNHDDEFMMKLKERLKTDVGMSLTLCAMQDSYIRIREKRDKHETQVAADGGRDPYAGLKGKQQGNFGVPQPQF